MQKLIPSLFLAVCSVSAGFSQTYIDGDWSYTSSENDGATITDYSGSGGPLVIPNSLGGFPVKTIGPDVFMQQESITSATIPYGVTRILDYAFFGCSNLSSVVIPGSVESIGGLAFSGCGITSLAVPSSVTSIGGGAFSDCKSLSSVAIQGSGATSIGQGAFARCSSLTSLSIGIGVTSIGSGAFVQCSSLPSVVIPDSVTSIGSFAFQGCTSLTTASLPSRFTAEIANIGFSGQLATDLMSAGLAEAISQRILAALPQNYGLATKQDLLSILPGIPGEQGPPGPKGDKGDKGDPEAIKLRAAISSLRAARR